MWRNLYDVAGLPEPEGHFDPEDEGPKISGETIESGADAAREGRKVADMRKEFQKKAKDGGKLTDADLDNLKSAEEKKTAADKKFKENFAKDLKVELEGVDNMYEANSPEDLTPEGKKALEKTGEAVNERMNKSGKMKKLIEKIKKEGRTEPTDAELKEITDDIEEQMKDDTSRTPEEKKKLAEKIAKILFALGLLGGILWDEHDDNSGCAVDGPNKAPGADHSGMVTIKQWKTAGKKLKDLEAACGCDKSDSPGTEIMGKMVFKPPLSGDDRKSVKCSDGYQYYWDSCSTACILGNIIKDGLNPIVDGPIDKLLDGIADALKDLFGDMGKYVGYAVIAIICILVLVFIFKLSGSLFSKRGARPAPAVPIK